MRAYLYPPLFSKGFQTLNSQSDRCGLVLLLNHICCWLSNNAFYAFSHFCFVLSRRSISFSLSPGIPNPLSLVCPSFPPLIFLPFVIHIRLFVSTSLPPASYCNILQLCHFTFFFNSSFCPLYCLPPVSFSTLYLSSARFSLVILSSTLSSAFVFLRSSHLFLSSSSLCVHYCAPNPALSFACPLNSLNLFFIIFYP